MEISNLIGLVFASVEVDEHKERMTLKTTAGREFVFYHSQDCCELVSINDITGDLADLVGAPILRAEEKTSDASDQGDDSGTWTFYTLATRKGYVDIRWLGTSNGYYSECVDLVEVK